MDLSPEAQLARIREHAVDLVPEDELLEKLRSGRSLRVKLGVDASVPQTDREAACPVVEWRVPSAVTVACVRS